MDILISLLSCQITLKQIGNRTDHTNGIANLRRVWPLVLVQCSSQAFSAIQPHLAFILGIHFASGRVLRLQSLCRFSVQFQLNVFKGHCVYVAKEEHSAPGFKTDKTIGSLSQGCHASAQDLSWGETGAAEKGIKPQKVNRSIPSPRLLIFSAPITLLSVRGQHLGLDRS